MFPAFSPARRPCYGTLPWERGAQGAWEAEGGSLGLRRVRPRPREQGEAGKALQLEEAEWEPLLARPLPAPDRTAPPAWPPATWQWPWHMTTPPCEGEGRGPRAAAPFPRPGSAVPPARGLLGALPTQSGCSGQRPLPEEPAGAESSGRCDGKEPRDWLESRLYPGAMSPGGQLVEPQFSSHVKRGGRPSTVCLTEFLQSKERRLRTCSVSCIGSSQQGPLSTSLLPHRSRPEGGVAVWGRGPKETAGCLSIL